MPVHILTAFARTRRRGGSHAASTKENTDDQCLREERYAFHVWISSTTFLNAPELGMLTTAFQLSWRHECVTRA